MSTEQEELIPEDEAARFLGVTPQRLKEFIAEGSLHGALVKGPNGLEVMYYRGEVLKLKERLRGEESEEEWPDVIDE